MQTFQTYFLSALRAALNNQTVSWESVSPADWRALFQLAQQHKVGPMIYEAVYHCPAAKRVPELMRAWKRQTMQQVLVQTQKTTEFLRLYAALREHGITPCVVKGILCRQLYPNPDERVSADEDLFVAPEQFAACHAFLLKYGMKPTAEWTDLQTQFEVSYQKTNSPLYLELHQQLFSPDSDAYGDWNYYFTQIHAQPVEIFVDGVLLRSMQHTDHLFYLLCHALKHFMHSGFGIRQVCDIVLYANAYGAQIEWDRLVVQCRDIHADVFAAALFRIGQEYLTLDCKTACLPACWKNMQLDETAMLEDLLDSGIYGGASGSRKHSSTMTLHAVAAQKQGKQKKMQILRTIFPKAKDLQGRYSYLQKKTFLLPLAWVDRLLHYRKESHTAVQSIQIGQKRTALLQQYGILKK